MIKRFLLGLVVIFVIGGAMAFIFRESVIGFFLFHPSTEMRGTPAMIGLEYRSVNIETPDGETLSAWLIPAGQRPDRPSRNLAVLTFHGNAGNISDRLDSIDIFSALGLDILIVDYRGYGHSTGTPSTQGITVDARATWDWLTMEGHVPPDKIVLHGHSLGGAAVAALSAEVEPAAIIMESTFTSLKGIGQSVYPYLPVSLFVNDVWDNEAALSGATAPLMVIHAPGDELVPYEMGCQLFEAYTGPKVFVDIDGPHGSGFIASRQIYQRALGDFLDTISNPTAFPAENNASD